MSEDTITLPAEFVMGSTDGHLDRMITSGWAIRLTSGKSSADVVFPEGTMMVEDKRKYLVREAGRLIYREGGSSEPLTLQMKLPSASVEELAEFARLNGTVPASAMVRMEVHFDVEFYGHAGECDRVADKIVKELKLQGIEPLELNWELVVDS